MNGQLPLFALFLLVALAPSSAGARTIVVDTTADSGPGSLRWAIERANERPEHDTIVFRIPGSGVRTLALLTALPAVVHPVTIDGQGKFATSFEIELRSATVWAIHTGLSFVGAPSQVRGLVLHSFIVGIELAGAGGHLVEDCRLGTDPTGLEELPIDVGVAVVSSGNVLRGNLISGSYSHGVAVTGDDNAFEANIVGADARGLAFPSNPYPQVYGLMLSGANRNLVQGNLFTAVLAIDLQNSSANILRGNRFGIAPDGVTPLYLQYAIWMRAQSDGNLIGGVGKGESNLVQALGVAPVGLLGGTANRVRGNLLYGTHPWAVPIRIEYPTAFEQRPIVDGARWNGRTTEISAAVIGPPGTSYDVDFYATTTPSSYGTCEAEVYLGSESVTVDSGGRGLVTFTVLDDIGVGRFVGATTTPAGGEGNTSEFSYCAEVLPVP